MQAPTTKFSINLNKFALIRNSRDNDYPNLVAIAKRAIAAGVDGITVHPRPDERHTRYQDVFDLAQVCKEHPGVEFNVEGNPVPKFLEVVEVARPDQCTLVPDEPGQKTSDHGYNMILNGEKLSTVVKHLGNSGIRVSCFIDADIMQIESAPLSRTDRIELYTEPYANAWGTAEQENVFMRFKMAARHAQGLGLGVNAGHDLNLANLGHFLTIPNILEVSIGHAVVVESFDYGFEETLRRYRKIIDSAGGH